MPACGGETSWQYSITTCCLVEGASVVDNDDAAAESDELVRSARSLSVDRGRCSLGRSLQRHLIVRKAVGLTPTHSINVVVLPSTPFHGLYEYLQNEKCEGRQRGASLHKGGLGADYCCRC